MTSDSKIFVGLKPIRKKAGPTPDASGPRCQWDGCEKAGTHRAPVGRDGEGLYLLFCLEHVRLYNAGYNYATGQSEGPTARYQKEAASGARVTQGQVAREAVEAPLPSTQRSGSAKALNARRSAAQRQAQKADLQKRKLKVLEARAFETLGLDEDASAEDIRRRYKEKLKMHHPDANQGERDTEGQLQASIEAYRIIKLHGFC
ncbi:curved DNA-binding protein CbpA [Neorhizobium huautlense]|uniref:Curved DNA-binding protein CbpA n=1 Tax=Neorhizobium huautlense TaxID=67774 RepID=A0ABT9Q0G7_9HYPH|nr:DnaJ domain-containing protein [Neorhizobium huautlense]MDP9839856.1 curved DNA-binding protein CbpA [Neorhizobium huautlense]